MTQMNTVHIISHTHWDREWYLPYEKHHVRLVKLMDDLLETLQTDPEFKSFHLDGQTIMLEDYLQIRPEKKAALERLIREGRIHIGPWYILQDEFLTSSESNVRNLLYGHKDAGEYGAISKVGYFPDSFGNMGQAPQLLLQAGINNAVFGRGVKPTGFNNEVSDSQAYESPYSEMIWEAPDGSRVLGILFANWYSNGNEIPIEQDAAKAYWSRKLKDVAAYASTPHWLMMNGCDHQPVQSDVAEAIRTAQRLMPEYRFVHSNFDDYIQAVKGTLPEQLSVVKGELRSQHTDGWSTLVNTSSSRIYLKQLNQQGQSLLEKAAEPLAAFAYSTGESYPHHLFAYAWKTLMQNHPHDSICGCSVDEVHSEMVTRFAKSRHVAESIMEESLSVLAAKLDTSRFAAFGEEAFPLLVTNTTGWTRTGIIQAEVDLKRLYFNGEIGFDEMKRTLKAISLECMRLVDPDGNDISCSIEDLGVKFGYDLPEDQFRQPYFVRKIKVTFEADKVPALGYKTYALVRDCRTLGSNENAESLITGSRMMENAQLAVTIEDDGSLTIADKRTDQMLKGLCIYEDTGDIGNEYMYRQPDNDEPIYTKGVQASIRVLEDSPYRAAFEIEHTIMIPESADSLLEQERQELVWFTGRKAGRSNSFIPLIITTKVSLARNGSGVHVETTFRNEARDHRLRVLFPTGINVRSHLADSIFEVAQRDNSPSPEWKNPSNCQHQQAFVTLLGDRQGLTIANLGLNEYEIVQDGNGTIAVTMLRAIGELGDWGYFPTPEAQCLGNHVLKFEIIPFPVESRSEESPSICGGTAASMKEAYQFQVPWVVKQTGIHTGELPALHSFLQWKGESLAFSTLKVSEETGDIIARWYNLSQEPQLLSVSPSFHAGQSSRSNILEERMEKVDLAGIAVSRSEIITLSLCLSEKEI